MGYLVYQLPGRVRIRTPHLANNQSNMRRAANMLSRTPGVESFTRNLTTGSITIRYDASSLSAGKIVNAFRKMGFLERVYGFPVEKRWAKAGLALPSGGLSTALTNLRRSSLPKEHVGKGTVAGLILAVLAEATLRYYTKRSRRQRGAEFGRSTTSP